MKLIHTVDIGDIGAKDVFVDGVCSKCGNRHRIRRSIEDVLGIIQECDLGRRIFEDEGVLKVESLEQRDRRLKCK